MNKDMDNCLEELYLDLMFAVCSEKDNNDTIRNVMASPPSKDVHVSAGCSTGQHVVKVWCLKLLTPTEETAALSQLSVCAPGCRVNKQAGAKWVRVEMGARPWPHANASSPVPHHHYCTLLRMCCCAPWHNKYGHTLFLFTLHNIDTVVQCFQFSHYCRQNHGRALLVSSSSQR